MVEHAAGNIAANKGVDVEQHERKTNPFNTISFWDDTPYAKRTFVEYYPPTHGRSVELC